VALATPDGAADHARPGQEEAGLPPIVVCNLARVVRELDRLPEAAAYAERCYQAARDEGQEAATNQALFVLAQVRRETGGLASAERTQAELARRLARTVPRDDLQIASLAVERSLLAAARSDFPTALAEADRAVALAETAGAPQYARRMLRARSEVNLLARRAGPAAEDAERAVRLELAATGTGGVSSSLGLAYLALGRARQAQGRREEALSALATAMRQLGPTLGEQHPATRSAVALVASLTTRPIR
jgi:tetratricopeptide (TPR) repeat protein